MQEGRRRNGREHSEEERDGRQNNLKNWERRIFLRNNNIGNHSESMNNWYLSQRMTPFLSPAIFSVIKDESTTVPELFIHHRDHQYQTIHQVHLKFL